VHRSCGNTAKWSAVVRKAATATPVLRRACLVAYALLATLLLSPVNSQWPQGALKGIVVDQFNESIGLAAFLEQIVDNGYNFVVLSFWASTAVHDAALAWQLLPSSQQQTTLQYFHNYGARLVLDAVADSSYPPTIPLAVNGSAFGAAAATYAVSHNLDGVNFYFNFGRSFSVGAYNTNGTIQWVVNATTAASAILGENAIITHLAQCTYFQTAFVSNAYTRIYQAVPVISYLLVQYYGNGNFTTFDQIFTNNSGASVQEISQAGVPLNKIAIVMPVLPFDGSPGYVSASDLNTFVGQALSEIGWNAGVVGYQAHDNTTNYNWINTIYPL